jgi:hypothetical protein
MDISEVTRRSIFDELSVGNVNWSGRLDEPAFLSRLYDLTEMVSTDGRFSDAAGDIWQHRVRNLDWSNDWVFTDPRFSLQYCADDVFLRFLCETLHPVVRADVDEVGRLRAMFNGHLRTDGWELYEQGSLSARPVFAGRRLLTGAGPAMSSVKAVVRTLDAGYVSQQMTRLEAALNGDPELVIGTAKEFVETVCRTLLEERGVTPDAGFTVQQLVRTTMEGLRLLPNQVDASAEGGRTLRMVLQNLATLAQGLAELRNPYGTGHGKPASSKGLELRHARLAVHAASALAVFLFESRDQEKVEDASIPF